MPPAQTSITLLDLDGQLDAGGGRLTLSPGQTHIFDDPGSVWFVRSGSLDLFAVQRRDGVQVGPRDYLCSLPVGAAVWGVDQSGEEDGIHLLALSSGDTSLSRVDGTTLDHWGTNPMLAQLLVRPVEQWVAGLSQGVTKYISPRHPPRLLIAPGEEMTPQENDRVISQRGGITWAWLREGTGFYIDIKEVGAPDGDTLVPLTGQGWLRAGNDCLVQGLATDAVLGGGRLSERLEAFHRWVFHILAYGFRNAAALEESWQRRRAGNLSNETDDVFLRFARLFDRRARQAGRRPGDEALFDCCTVVGRVQNLAMRLPSSARRRRAEEPPMTIADIASASQLRARQVTLSPGWWRLENGPMVGFRQEDGRPVALLQRSPSTMVMHDPAQGTESVVTEAVAATLAPIAHVFFPSLPGRPVTLVDLLALCLRQIRADAVVMTLLGAGGGLLAVIIPLATGYVFDTVIPGHQIPELLQMAIAIAVAAITGAAFEFGRSVAQLRIEGRVSGTLQAAFMDRLLRLPSRFFAGYSSGDLAQRTLVVEAIRRSLTGVALSSLVTGVFSIFSLILLIYYSPPMAGVVVGLIGVLGLATVVTGMALRDGILEVEESTGQVNGQVLEVITGITKLRIAGAEERAFNRWGRAFGRLRAEDQAARWIKSRFSVFWATYDILGLTCIFLVIGKWSPGSGMTTGTFLAFVAAFSGLMESVFGLAKAAIALYAVTPLYRRALPILRTETEGDATKADPGTLRGEVEVSGVYFRYAANMPHVLKGLSLTVQPGELIAVVGASGSGKSTLMRLLLGLDLPEAGAIYYNGRDLRGLDLRAVRRQIGAVLQDDRLMPGSIYENIKGATQATVDECWDAAVQVGLDHDIRAMPMQMHTVLTEGAAALSGGQVQRLLIARALVGKPSLLLLDEATSALDNRAQAVVIDSLKRLSVTRIVIAHRLSTIMGADRIYVMREGQIAEMGDYDELMGRNGIFAALAHRQQL